MTEVRTACLDGGRETKGRGTRTEGRRDRGAQLLPQWRQGRWGPRGGRRLAPPCGGPGKPLQRWQIGPPPGCGHRAPDTEAGAQPAQSHPPRPALRPRSPARRAALRPRSMSVAALRRRFGSGPTPSRRTLLLHRRFSPRLPPPLAAPSKVSPQRSNLPLSADARSADLPSICGLSTSADVLPLLADARSADLLPVGAPLGPR